MCIRLLICEPDQQLRESYVSYFERSAEFAVASVSSVNECLCGLRTFCPNVLMLEPERQSDTVIIVLDNAEIPVLILSRFCGNDKIRLHSSVCKYYVKPVPLREVKASIQEIAG